MRILSDIVVHRVFVLSLFLAACNLTAQQSRALNDRIPPANHEAYRQVRDASQWKNPYLVVHRDGIKLIRTTVNGTPIPVDKVVGVLEHLPTSAWPYGRVVAVQDNNINASGDAPHIKSNRQKLVRLLHDIGIEVESWP